MKKLAIPLTVAAAIAGFTHTSQAEESEISAVLTTWAGSVHNIEIKGLKNTEACLQLASVAAQQGQYASATVSCLKDGEIIAAQKCSSSNTCEAIALKP